MADNQHFQYINKLPYFKEIYGKSKPFKTLVKNLFLPPQRTLDLEYQDGGDELQSLITEITATRDPGLFISVMLMFVLNLHIISILQAFCAIQQQLIMQSVTY